MRGFTADKKYRKTALLRHLPLKRLVPEHYR